MKSNSKKFQIFKFAVIAATITSVCPNRAIAGPITGDTITGSNFYLGGTGVNLKYNTSGTDIGALYSDLERSEGRFYWRDNVSDVANYKMQLGTDNVITLYKYNTVNTVGMVLDPSSGKIDLKGTVGAGLYSGTTPLITLSSATGANLTVSTMTASGDSYINGVRFGRGAGGLNGVGEPTNTALGNGTLIANTSGNQNTASGTWALGVNTSGSQNSALGCASLAFNTIGNGNSAFGASALYYIVGASSPPNTGSYNTAVGSSAGAYYGDPAINPQLTLTSASFSTYIGAGSRALIANETNSIVIGANAIGKGSNTTVIGSAGTLQTHLAGQTVTNSLSVAGQASAGSASFTGQTSTGSLNVTGSTVLGSASASSVSVSGASNLNSLSVSGATVLNGAVVLAAPQGDITMGVYGN